MKSGITEITINQAYETLKDNSVSDEVLEFMKEASLDKLQDDSALWFSGVVTKKTEYYRKEMGDDGIFAVWAIKQIAQLQKLLWQTICNRNIKKKIEQVGHEIFLKEDKCPICGSYTQA